RQYTGRAAATLSQAQAALGNFDEAMYALAPVEGDTDVEIAGARTNGYLEIARGNKFTTEQHLKALEASELSARNLPPWEQVGVLTDIARLYVEAGHKERSSKPLKSAEEIA